ncbi:MAG TPA: BlaI/MecI/CopY family transcriptional regulator [Pyrinomonadaceae bacterium]|jgi:predicted transcriptional regulator|nr:BlaI/MecI/CopY family transcriptional regulator [Pyrinomonadaceae bacterium]
MKVRLRGFKRLADAVTGSLGELEQNVMSELRQQGERNVTGVLEGLGGVHAYTTVMTTLDRLYKKGLLQRRKQGRAFYYSVKYSKAEVERTVAEDVLSRLLDSSLGRVEPVLACIVDSVSERDRELLDELERLVKAKRKELAK